MLCKTWCFGQLRTTFELVTKKHSNYMEQVSNLFQTPCIVFSRIKKNL